MSPISYKAAGLDMHCFWKLILLAAPTFFPGAGSKAGIMPESIGMSLITQQNIPKDIFCWGIKPHK